MGYEEDELGGRGRGRGGRAGNELVLSPGEYAYIQDTTNGVVKTHCGPVVINLAGSARAIRFNPQTQEFQEVELHEAVNRDAYCPLGSYLVLENPVKKDDQGIVLNNANEFPTAGTDKPTPEIEYGQKTNIPGPCCIALWPQQIATVLEGHELRSDQYLQIRITDENAAKANWNQAITKKVQATENDEVAVVEQDADELDLGVGRLMHIKGTEVSFYIPPTGVEVVPYEDEEGETVYVRDALTLEMAEQCILIDQKGKKRYEKGPAVVFPEPTEEFFEENGNIKFPPIELNHLQGLHLKANCDYKVDDWPTLGPDGAVTTGQRIFKEGEEFWITGRTHPMYFPREEEGIVRYGKNLIHYATCIPAGEGRYVMDRESGTIETVKGPKMLLLNPIEKVMVRRVLTDQESELMYPGNDESLDYNRKLRAMLGTQPSTRSGFVSEGDYSRGSGLETPDMADYEERRVRRVRSRGRKSSEPPVPDEFSRKTEYTKPHMVTLGGNTKFDGVPKLIIWTGYAVLVVKADGTRRVEVGPKTILLDFDETIEPIHLSKGTPKSADSLMRTGYLRVVNNKVSDLVCGIETKDNIRVDVGLSYRVTFDDAAKEKWFDVENYVQFLVEHARSKLKGLVKGFTIEQFYDDSVAIVRDIILGAQGEDGKRPLLSFVENGMKVTDVEVLATPIQDKNIADLLVRAQHETIEQNIAVDRAKKRLEVVKEQEDVSRQESQTKFETVELQKKLDLKQIGLVLKVAMEDYKARQEQEAAASNLATAEEETAEIHHNAQLSRKKQLEELRQQAQEADTKAVTDKLSAAQEGLAEAILALSNQETLTKIAEATSIQTLLGGKNFAEVLSQIFQGSPLEGAFKQVSKRGAFTGIGTDE